MTGYLDWQSGISAEQVFSSGQEIAYPTLSEFGVLFLTTVKQDKSRYAVAWLNQQQQLVTPAPFSVRTSISEYGGKPYWVFGNDLYFSNQEDQCLYRQQFNGTGFSKPAQVSRADATIQYMYADVVQPASKYLFSIVEQVETDTINQSYIASLDIDGEPATPVILSQGSDFYSNLVVDSQRQRLAWVEWDHPDMPWDSTRLCVAEFALNGDEPALTQKNYVNLPPDAAVCQLLFAPNGRLFFVADFKGCRDADYGNYWNVYVVDPLQGDMTASIVTTETAEFGYPHWQYGDARLVQFDAQTILALASTPTHDELFQINHDTYAYERVRTLAGQAQYLAANGAGRGVLVYRPRQRAPELIQINKDGELTVLLSAQAAVMDESEISVAEHLQFNCSDGSIAYGHYYPPRNLRYRAEGPPPLLVMVHGGPTARSVGSFDLQKQFWTNRGFAVFDVNHRGSSGYGRAFRDSLYGHWGEKDVSDIIDGIRYLTEQGLAAADQVCIRGKSAGGYAVLCALTSYPDCFKAGASYYGIGNLLTLASVTHKFEKFYTDRLIGETFDPVKSLRADSRFQQRSPVNHMSKLQTAMILFQGSLDKVVPPNLAQEVVKLLNSAGVPHIYVEYEDEGHGFRQIANNMDAWQKELNFYRGVLVG